MRIFTRLIYACLIFMMFVLCSCFKQQQLLFKERGPNPDSLSAVLKNSGNGTSDYRIQSQDILQIRNLQNIRYVVEETPTSSGGGAGISQQGQT